MSLFLGVYAEMWNQQLQNQEGENEKAEDQGNGSAIKKND